jgi:hypothetical protein
MFEGAICSIPNSRDWGQSVQDWGQSVQSLTLEKDVAREECNVMLQCGDNTSSVSSDKGLTTLECETHRAKAASICPEEKEVT